MKRVCLSVVVLFIFAEAVWFIGVPGGFLRQQIQDSLGGGDFFFEIEDLKKGFFFSFSADRVLLKRKNKASDSALLVFDNARGRVDPLSLLRLRPELLFEMAVNDGSLSGSAGLTEDGKVQIEVKGVSMHGLPFLEQYGIVGDGRLSGSVNVANEKGTVTFTIADARLDSGALRGLPLSLESFRTIRGILLLNDGGAEVKSLALEGKGIYARVKGRIQQETLNLQIELMTESQPGLEPGLLALLQQYRVSPGYYVIPYTQKL